MADATTGAAFVRDDELITGEAVALDVRAASVFHRAAGAAIDVLVYGGMLILVLLLASGFATLSLDAAAGQALVTALLVTCLVLAPMLVETFSGGRSLGKLAVGVRIVRDDGGAIRLRHAFIRALTGVFEVYLTLGGLALLIGFLSNRSKRVGDLLAGTYSQVERVPPAPDLSIDVPLELADWSQTADVGRLPDRLSRRIAQFLAQAPHLVPASRRRSAAALASEATPYVAPVPDTDPELLLAAIAAMRRVRETRALDLEDQRLRALDPVLTMRPHGFPQR